MQCLRCLHDTAKKIAAAPDGSGAWDVILCERCNYVWRTPEEAEITNPAMRDPFFQLDKKDLDKIVPNNVVPPLNKKAAA